jgi:hypothetical protein
MQNETNMVATQKTKEEARMFSETISCGKPPMKELKILSAIIIHILVLHKPSV